MAEESKSSKKPQPISDVEHPGKTAANPTSKSIIIKNGPIIKDPMVVEDSEAKIEDDTTKNVVKAGGSSKIKLQPLPVAENEEPKQDESSQDIETPIVEAPKQDEEKSVESNGEAKPEKTTEKKDATFDKETEEKDKSTNTPAEEEEAEASRKAEHDANLQKIVDSKTYYLPINAVEKRRSKRFVLLGIAVSILLILLWVNIALDAGLIKIDGLSPMTHFFSS